MSQRVESQATSHRREELLHVAREAAQRAASLIRDRTAGRETMKWREKGQADFVTDVDTASEAVIRAHISGFVPGAAIIGEETSPLAQAGSSVTFVVDPLDGTTNFIHGFPEYAVSIGVWLDGAPAAGVILDVPRGDCYTAIREGGSQLNGAPIHVSGISDPARALIGTGFPFKQLRFLEKYQSQFAAVTRVTSGIRRAGSAAMDLAHVAAGRFDAFWELELAPWDFCAGSLLVSEAGGIVSDFDGRYPPLSSSAIVAGNVHMHAWLLHTLTPNSP